jgi:glucan phosphoethanolaminetransferase (alkaline phosphatase superfamily)
VPLSSFIGEKDSLVLYLYQVKTLVPGFSSPFTPFFILPLLISVTLIVIISIVTIFLYKKRKLQLILVRFMLLLLLIYLGVYFFYYIDILENQSGGYASYQYSVPILETGMEIPTVIFIIPLVSAMLLFMAARGITNDEKLVRSTDRLR